MQGAICNSLDMFECAACICDLIPRLMHADVVTCASTSLHLVLLPMHLPPLLVAPFGSDQGFHNEVYVFVVQQDLWIPALGFLSVARLF